MNSMKVTLSAYRDAHKFIWEEGIIKLIKVPLLLTLAYFPFMFLTAYFLAEFFIGFLLDMLGAFVSEGGWVEFILKFLVFILFAVFIFIAYRSVVLFFYLFSIDKITDRVEIFFIGKRIECERSPRELIKRCLLYTSPSPRDRG